MPLFLGGQCWCPLDKTPFPGAKTVLTRCVCADLLCFVFSWNLEGMSPWLAWRSLFWQDINLCWKPCFSGAVSQRHLGNGLPGCSPQFGSSKTLLYPYYIDCLLIISVLIAWCSWQDIRKTHRRSPGIYFGPVLGTKPRPLERHPPAPSPASQHPQMVRWALPHIRISLY